MTDDEHTSDAAPIVREGAPSAADPSPPQADESGCEPAACVAPAAELDAPEVEDDDVLEVVEDREELEAAMRDLFVLEVRRVATESFRRTRLRDQEREQAAREHARALRLRIAAETEARLAMEHRRDVERDRLQARIAELVGELAREEQARRTAETRASSMENAARVAEGMLAKSRTVAFEHGLAQLRRTIRWTSSAAVALAALVLVVVLSNESIAQAVFRRASGLAVPSETVAEIEVVTGAARPWIASAPAEKPSPASAGPTSTTHAAPKPRLSRTRARPAIVATPSATPPRATPSVARDDDPLGGLDDL
ncbi:MAG: hypothetical protein IT379_07785 [Deltaproteobacteria bacterium]|nr:hypothetical protein [Deltaproteobacteria bacterium]